MKKLLIIQPAEAILAGTLKGLPLLQPQVIRYLAKIAEELKYELVVLPVAGVMKQKASAVQTLLKNEGIELKELELPYGDVADAVVVGTSSATEKFAKKIKAGFIKLATQKNKGMSWPQVYGLLLPAYRIARHKRVTKETAIAIELNPDGTGKAEISTGLSFFDHMLEQIARHGGIDLKIKAKGDLHIDEHHTIEDTGITLGETFALALADKRGMERYGFCLPMDDALAQVAIDFGGRAQLVWKVDFKREKIGDVPTELFSHFFKSFCDAAKCNLNVQCEGENEHHKIEAVFKAFAKAVKMAVKKDLKKMELPSTKGTL